MDVQQNIHTKQIVENVKLANEQIVELPTHTTNQVEENYQNQQNNQNTESYTVPGTYDSMTCT